MNKNINLRDLTYSSINKSHKISFDINKYYDIFIIEISISEIIFDKKVNTEMIGKYFVALNGKIHGFDFENLVVENRKELYLEILSFIGYTIIDLELEFYKNVE